MAQPLPDLTGLLLAGGHSRRFGRDKALHVVAGQPMVVRVYEAVRAVATPVYLSLREPPAVPYPVPASVLPDRVPGAGPLAGLEAGLAAMATPWLLVVACDLPFLTPAALRRLAAARTPETQAVVARAPDGRRQPLCACYAAAVAPIVTEQLEQGHRALYQLLQRLGSVTEVPLPEAVLRNVNRLEDLD